MNLKGFQGYVKKGAAILSDDPVNSRVVVFVEGRVKPLIEVQPEKTIYFQGTADHILEKTVDLVTTSEMFHIRRVEDDLGKKVSYKLETVEDGKHYRLRVANNISRGFYRGSITLYTDFNDKPELTVWVNGLVEGEIGVRPKDLVVGRLSPDQGMLTGKILVVDNMNKAFKIVNCTYDERIISVRQESFQEGFGFSLEVSPKMDNIPPGSRLQTTLTVQTDVSPEEKQQVRIQAVNLAGVVK